MNVMVDSGSPSFYNTYVRKKKSKGIMGSFLKDRVNDDYSFIEADVYKKYKQSYIDFLLENKDSIDIYVNLDIVNNAKATWDNQLELEAVGLNPIPVFHFGSDMKWLRMLLDKGYPYIAIGGIIPNPVAVLQPVLDDLWANILTDKDGMPIVKVHGFAVTSARLVVRYPWYSSDSTSWTKIGIYGAIVVPRVRGGQFIYDGSPHVVFVSNKSGAKDEIGGRHIDTMTSVEREYILEYLKQNGVALGRSSYKKEKADYTLKENENWVNLKLRNEVEIIEEQGVSNCYELRNRMNLLFFFGLQKSIPEWPWAFKRTVKGFNL